MDMTEYVFNVGNFAIHMFQQALGGQEASVKFAILQTLTDFGLRSMNILWPMVNKSLSNENIGG